MTNHLDETAGRQAWSESGLVLLDNIMREVDRWVTPINETYTRCPKPNCAYCQWIERQKQAPKELVTITLQSSFNEVRNIQAWSDEDISILKSHIDWPLADIVGLFKNRTEAALSTKRNLLRHELNLPKLKRFRIVNYSLYTNN